MEVKEMRVFLKEQGLKVPRSNEEVKKAYKAAKVPAKTANVVTLASDNIFTYIGSGDTPPEKINFMGKQVFIRGQATEVNDITVRVKIASHSCFISGKADTKDLETQDEKEAKRAAKIQKEAAQIARMKLG